MRVIYADAGLRSEVGHHANTCRFITAVLAERGHQVEVAAWDGIVAPLRDELAARRHFRRNAYWGHDGDPVCGWLSAFFTAAQSFGDDLGRLGPFAPDDLLYVNSALPPQLMGVAQFLDARPAPERPQVVVELGTEPGLDLVEQDGETVFQPRDPRLDARATLYRFAGRHIEARASARLHLASFDPSSAELYTQLLGRAVLTLPLPHFAARTPVLRSGYTTRTIGVLGHQRGEKGYHLMPAIVERVLRMRPDARFLVHNAEPDFMAETQAAMRALAAIEPRLVLDERPAGPTLWQSLLDASDLILCPYMPGRFRAGYSAVAAEAIANAAPLVVPDGTTLSRLLQMFGEPGVCFGFHAPDSIAEAICSALDRFGELAALAFAASRRWQATMGAERMVEAMLAHLAAADMAARSAGGAVPVQHEAA